MRVSLALPLLAAAPLAQTVHVVDDDGGPGVDFTDLATAVTAAAPGDAVLIRSGSYAGFTVDGKSLTVTADETAVVRLSSGFTVENVPLGSRVLLRGLGVDFLAADHCLLRNNVGFVGLEDCTFDGIDPLGAPAPNAALEVSLSSRVVLTRCVVLGGVTPQLPGVLPGAGVRADFSNVYVYGTTVRGADGIDGAPGDGAGGGAALSVSNGFAFASGCVLVGGDGGDGVTAPLGCGHGGWGGAGLATGFQGTSYLQDTATAGGAGGLASGPLCNDGLPAPGITGPVNFLPGTAHSLDVTTPVRMGALAHNVLVGEPGEIPFLAIALQPEAIFTPFWLGVLLVGLPVNPVQVGLIPPGGVLTFDLPVPVVPGVESLQVFEQVAFVDFATATVTLSSPAYPLLLDSSF